MLLLQLLRGGEELVAVRSVGSHVAEDDALVVRTAQRAEDSWRRQRAAEREAVAAAAAGRQSLNGGTGVPFGLLDGTAWGSNLGNRLEAIWWCSSHVGQLSWAGTDEEYVIACCLLTVCRQPGSAAAGAPASRRDRPCDHTRGSWSGGQHSDPWVA